jgi:hypothetical protein
MKTDLLGPYAKARQWLLNYIVTSRFTHPELIVSLEANWTAYHREKAAYILGVIWGRLRQSDTKLENSSEFAQLVTADFGNDE